MIDRVVLSKRSMRQLRGVPHHVRRKVHEWLEAVERVGVERVRRRPGYHDEPLLGRRWGQRSIRVSRSYRLIYRVSEDAAGQYLGVEDVTKHGY